MADWSSQLDKLMRASAGERNPSEWYKKSECWDDIKSRLPKFADPLPQELSYAKAGDGAASAMMPEAGTISSEDYERIARCMTISSSIWLEISEKGKNAQIIHWRVAGICQTLAGYAAGGWQRKPSAKQAKPALNAALAVERAGLVNVGLDVQATNADQA